MLVGGLSRGVRGGQTRRPVGSGASPYLLTTQLGPQFTLYFYSAAKYYYRTHRISHCVLCVGSGVYTYLPATQEQHDVYVYVGLCVCRSVTPNSGVKSEKHFHLELIHSAAKDLCLSVLCD